MLLKRRIKIDLGKAFIHDNQSQTPVTDLFNIQCLSPAEELPTRCHCSCTQPGSQPTRTESTTSLFLLLDFLNSFLKNVQLNWAKSKVTSNPENKDLEQSLIFFLSLGRLQTALSVGVGVVVFHCATERNGWKFLQAHCSGLWLFTTCYPHTDANRRFCVCRSCSLSEQTIWSMFNYPKLSCRLISW